MFEGGIHPHYGKEMSMEKSLERLPLQKRLILPFSQHIGAPSKSVVSVGDLVKKGQVVAHMGGFVSAPVHASSSGKVIGILRHLHPSGRLMESVAIETDGQDEWLEGMNTPQEISADISVLRKQVLEAGIVGLGGATFPTHVKLTPPKDKKIDTIFLNGAECEPFLTCDYRIMVEMPEEVIRGLMLVMQISEAKRAYVGVEDNKPEAIKKLKAVVSEIAGDAEISVESLETKYPQGGEKMLIKSLTGREVPMGGLPMDVGGLVINVGTAVAIHRAISLNTPLVERVVTVTGPGIAEPRNLIVPIGTLVSEVVNHCGGINEDARKVILGGPMMGAAQYSMDLPVIKGTSGILILTSDEVVSEEPRACINCGRCVNVCPMGLLPNKLSICGEALNADAAEEYYPFQCMECGCCSYVCPSKRPIVQYIKFIKAELGKKAKAAVGGR